MVSSTLHSSTELYLGDPYVDEHKNSLRSKHPEQCDDWITCEHIRTFSIIYTEARLVDRYTIYTTIIP